MHINITLKCNSECNNNLCLIKTYTQNVTCEFNTVGETDLLS